MSQKLTKEYVKNIIFEAFKDVSKGEGLGARECIAHDDYLYGEDAKEYKEQDIEWHWFEYPKKLIEDGVLDYSLTYNNKDGIRFHLPAVMTASVDGYGETGDISIFRTLCLETFEFKSKMPHPYHQEYIGYLRLVDVIKIINYYQFTTEQVHAIALYFLFDVSCNTTWTQFFSSRDEIVSRAEKDVQRPHNKEHYNLTAEDAVAIVDEEHRILRDWFRIGNVDSNVYVYVDE